LDYRRGIKPPVDDDRQALPFAIESQLSKTLAALASKRNTNPQPAPLLSLTANHAHQLHIVLGNPHRLFDVQNFPLGNASVPVFQPHLLCII
jgi:hypothetical protein